MKIISEPVVHSVTKWVHVNVLHNGQKFEISLIVVDGKATGRGCDGIYTSYLTYFNDVPQKIREKHAQMLREYVEKSDAAK